MVYRQPKYDPKSTTYLGDGTGRDTYIHFNNGGIYRDKYLVQGGFERGKFPIKRHYSGNPIPVKGKILHYQCNGTGRDSYIDYNSGGLCQMNARYANEGRQNFIGSLRKYQRSIRLKTNSSLLSCNNSDINYSPNRFQYSQLNGIEQVRNSNQRLLNSLQRRSIERLSFPKAQQDPYKPIRKLTSTIYK